MSQPLIIAGAVFSFIFGAVIGSFLNVCIYRLPAGESLLYPPSHCPRCNARLTSRDLVPMLSFLWLGRRCRTCQAPISWRYFTIELLTALLFTACFFALHQRYGAGLASHLGVATLAMLAIWASAMLVTFMIDLDTTYVIEPVTWVAMAAGLLFTAGDVLLGGAPVWTLGIHFASPLATALAGAGVGIVIGFLAFVLMNLFGWLIFRKPGMGLGDSYIGAAIGALLGPGLALLSFGLAIVLGALVGIVLIVAGMLAPTPAPGAQDSVSDGALKETDDDMPQGRYMPFGPFLTASAVLIALLPANAVTDTVAQLWAQYLTLFR